MDIILLQKVENLGGLGDKVSVKNGYGRNFLIPSGMAVAATTENIKVFEARRAELEKKAAERLASAEARKAKLDGLSITIACKSGDEGRLFGSVGSSDIAKAISATGNEVAKKEVILHNSGTFRQTGDYDVELVLHADVSATVKLSIIPE